jgi:WD40 repeat protein
VEASDRGDTVILVDPSGRENPRTKAFSQKIRALAFSEDGQHMAVAVGRDEAITTVVRLKLDGLIETARFDAGEPIATVAINADGTLIAVAGTKILANKSAVRVWWVPWPSVLGFFDQATVPTLSYEVQAAEAIESVALSPDGTNLATASFPEAGVGPHLVLQVWTFAQDTLAREACRRIGRDLTLQEWATYLPGEPYKPTCSRLR